MNTIHLEIVTPEGLIFSNDAKMVVLPGADGEFGVLPGHASLVSLLKIGVVDIENLDGSHDAVAIDWLDKFRLSFQKLCEEYSL